jgi:hypothetical protein
MGDFLCLKIDTMVYGVFLMLKNRYNGLWGISYA